jgi:hypothetical protein
MGQSPGKPTIFGSMVMFDPARLREQAAEFRALAWNVTDRQRRLALVKLALTYDAIAQRIDIGSAIARA